LGVFFAFEFGKRWPSYANVIFQDFLDAPRTYVRLKWRFRFQE
jgi:hypothetical protein